MIDKFYNENEFLSNFYPAKIYLDGKGYPTIEHAYQAAKSLHLGDRNLISSLRPDQAGKAKRLGKKFVLRSDWEDIKIEVMEKLLRQKFDQSALKQKLLNTGSQKLVEGNHWHDNYWGDCRCQRCGGVINGLNMLGILLMKLREEYYENINSR
jgi:ribA/ribD-fused uncharacterized protein